jgi:hypothetical protein
MKGKAMNLRWLLFGFAMLALTAHAEISGGEAPPQVRQITAKDLGMERSDIARPDSTVWIFSGSGKSMPRRWSLTGFDGLNYNRTYDGYRFHFNFVEKRSGVTIRDDVHETMDGPVDPLGCNFRSDNKFCIVPQEDTWYPYFERKTGSFLKNFKTGTVSFGIETRTIMPARIGEVLLEISIENRDEAPLTLTLQPWQNSVNTLQSLVSDIETARGQGLEWTIPSHTQQTHHFAIIAGAGLAQPGQQPHATFEPTLAERVRQADQDGEARILAVAGRLPSLQTSNHDLGLLYKRCITTLVVTRWDYPQARNHPTWWSWSGPLLTAWDFSFGADTFSLIDPQFLRAVVLDVLGIGKMQASYIDPDVPNAQSPILYIQDPFALQDVVSSLIKITGDRTILDDKAGEHTVYEWLKLWAAKLDTFAKRPDGLIDMGDGNEFLLELRTDGYDHVVPTVNGLAVKYFRWLAQLAEERNDPDAVKYAQRAAALDKSFQNLWDEKAGWFDNLYPDDSRKPVFTMHLFDLLGTSVVNEHQKQRISSHFVEGDFLAPLGIYSISKKDTVHWDRFDQDWGGGGAYIGTPLRTARYLYEDGDFTHGWQVLKRISLLAEHFSYLPQSPAMDEPYENFRGGNVNVSAGAGCETIWSGIFGLRPQTDGSLVVRPAPFNPQIGKATLTDFQFRQHRYAVELLASDWRVFLDGKLWARKKYGQSVTISPQQPRS